MTLIQVACGALAAFTYGSFIWGFFGVFVKKGQPSPKLNLLSVLALVAAISQTGAIVSSANVAGATVLPGVVLYLGSLSLFFWTARTVKAQPLSLAFSPDVPEHLHAAGPYRWVRHPFYSSYLLAYVAGWVLCREHWLLAVIAVMTWVYVDAARTEERKFASSQLADGYQHYRDGTGMFLPRVKRAEGRPSGASARE
jgi:protein-S-isoprenylcysteine O-methyltransferase Ste14